MDILSSFGRQPLLGELPVRDGTAPHGFLGDLATDQCIAAGGDPDACAKASGGDYKGAATATGGSAAATACIAAGIPLAAGACYVAGSAIVSGVAEFFSSDTTCNGWICSQDTPEAWAHWMSPQSIEQVNRAFNLWLASGDPAIAPYLKNVIHPNAAPCAPDPITGSCPADGQEYWLDAILKQQIPATTLRRAWLSLWYQQYVNTYGVNYVPPVVTPPAPSPGNDLAAACNAMWGKHWDNAKQACVSDSQQAPGDACAMPDGSAGQLDAQLACVAPSSAPPVSHVARNAAIGVAAAAAAWIGWRTYKEEPIVPPLVKAKAQKGIDAAKRLVGRP